jgi:hypothetical protein
VKFLEIDGALVVEISDHCHHNTWYLAMPQIWAAMVAIWSHRGALLKSMEFPQMSATHTPVATVTVVRATAPVPMVPNLLVTV